MTSNRASGAGCRRQACGPADNSKDFRTTHPSDIAHAHDLLECRLRGGGRQLLGQPRLVDAAHRGGQPTGAGKRVVQYRRAKL